MGVPGGGVTRCGATLRAPSGNELAKARALEADAPLLAQVVRAGQEYTCTRPDGHDGPHREDWGRGIGVEWGPEIEALFAPPTYPAPPKHPATTRARR